MVLWCVWDGLERFEEDGESLPVLRVAAVEDDHRLVLLVYVAVVVLSSAHLQNVTSVNMCIFYDDVSIMSDCMIR